MEDHRRVTPGHAASYQSELHKRAKTWTFTYNGQSRLLTETDPLSRVTTYAYGSGPNTSPTLITLPGGKKIAATYNKAWGYKTASVTTAYGFDTLGNPHR